MTPVGKQTSMNSAHEAAALYDQGRYAESEALLAPWVRDHPDDVRGKAGLDRLLMMQGRAPVPETAQARVDLARNLAAAIGPATLQGADEGPRLQQAAELIMGVLPELATLAEGARPIAARILWRTGHYEAATAVGGPAELAGISARAGQPAEMLHQLARVETEQERSPAARGTPPVGRRT
jgi:hypothetical protein